MDPRAALLLAVAASGCASAVPAEEPAAPEAPVPEVLQGVPISVIVERALFDLESGEPAREARARGILLAIPAGPALDPLRARWRTAPRGSDARLEALAVLAERREIPEGCDPAEVVAMSLREIERSAPSGRPALLALERLRALGEAARRPLRSEALGGGSRSATAAAVLLALHGEAPPRAEARP